MKRNKMKRKLNQILNSFTAILTGLTMSSLWITNNDNWKIYLPLIFICIGLRNAIDDAE